MCKSKDQGGLGVKNLREQNIALLGKWLWKALSENDLDWVKLLKSRLYHRRKLERLDGRPLVGAFAFWKGVWKCYESFRCG